MVYDSHRKANDTYRIAHDYHREANDTQRRTHIASVNNVSNEASSRIIWLDEAQNAGETEIAECCDSVLLQNDRQEIPTAVSDGNKPHSIESLVSSTHRQVEAAAIRLLARFPYAPALMTVNPDTVRFYSESVEYLYAIGFRYLICSLNYAATWDKSSLKELKRQYEKLADFYYEHTIAEDKFYLSPFEVKISSHVHNKTYCHERCELGQRQLSVAPDGGLYPCVQFVGDERYRIGDVFQGIDEKARQHLFIQNETEKPGCDVCAIQKRCNHYCACLNKQATGSIDTVSEALCAHERIILPIADRVAKRLYKKSSPLFIQKHYNDFYPLISLIEDRSMSSEAKAL